MLNITSDIEGKQAYYGNIRKHFEKEGFHICGNWEYYEAFFDSILSRNGGTTIYLRLPAKVVQGKLDQEDAFLEFGCPFVIKHVVHTGFIEDDFAVADLTGFNQFQKPLDPDDRIERKAKWEQAGEQALNRIKEYVH